MNIDTAKPGLPALFAEQRRLLTELLANPSDKAKSKAAEFLGRFHATVLGGTEATPADRRFDSCCLVWRSPGSDFGSGVVVAPTVVLTAAHVCCATATNFVSVPLLNYRDRVAAQIAVVDRVILPADCNPISIGSQDVAMLLLAGNVQNSVSIPSLGTASDLQAARTSGVTLCGFGAAFDEGGDYTAGVKRFADTVPVIDPRTMSFINPPFDPNLEFLAGGKGADGNVHDSCPYDSGGPVYFTRQDGLVAVIGITSRGAHGGSCGPAGSIYTRVDAQATWIRKTAKEKWNITIP
jgi:hypothetical protein